MPARSPGACRWAWLGALGGGLRAGGEIGQLGGGAGEVRRGPKWALVGRLASWYGVANPPNTRYIYFRCVVVNTTGNMDHRERYIYINPYAPPKVEGWDTPGWRAPRGTLGGPPPEARPKDPSRDFTNFQTAKSPKNPKCHSAFRKGGPLCMVFLSCTDHPHTKIVPRSNF